MPGVARREEAAPLITRVDKGGGKQFIHVDTRQGFSSGAELSLQGFITDK